MMNQILKYKLLLLLLIIAHAGWAIDLSRTIKKNYSVSDQTSFSINNSFGKVHINNWEKSEIQVEVEIIGKSSSENRAQSILDRIEIDIRESSSEISFRTELNNLKTRGNDGFEVHYTVSMPASNPINVRNSFGDVYLDDRNGAAELDVSYGAIKAKDFNEESSLKLAFGKGYLGHFERGRVNVKYSDLEIRSSKMMDMDQQFSNVELNEVGELDLDSKYGSVELGVVGEVDVDVDFSGFSIEELQRSIDMESGYVSDFEIELLRKDFEYVDIEGKYGSYEIRLEEGLSADLEASFKYSDLRVYGADIDYYYRVRDNNENEYKARIGGGDSSKRISIRSTYGNCKITD